VDDTHHHLFSQLGRIRCHHFQIPICIVLFFTLSRYFCPTCSDSMSIVQVVFVNPLINELCMIQQQNRDQSRGSGASAAAAAAFVNCRRRCLSTRLVVSHLDARSVMRTNDNCWAERNVPTSCWLHGTRTTNGNKAKQSRSNDAGRI